MIGSIFSVLIVVLAINPSSGQSSYFEFHNPDAIELDDKKTNLLTSKRWVGGKVLFINRGDTTRTICYSCSLHYSNDGSYIFQNTGKWKIIENKVIEHIPDESHRDSKLFGGMYSVKQLSDSILVITKVLTSSFDMSRIYYFVSEEKRQREEEIARKVYEEARKKAQREEFLSEAFWWDHLSPNEVDSISHMGFWDVITNNFEIRNDTIIVKTKDGIFEISWKKKE